MSKHIITIDRMNLVSIYSSVFKEDILFPLSWSLFNDGIVDISLKLMNYNTLVLVYQTEDNIDTILKLNPSHFHDYDSFLNYFSSLLKKPDILKKIDEANKNYVKTEEDGLVILTEALDFIDGVVVDEVFYGKYILTKKHLQFVHDIMNLDDVCSGKLVIGFLEDNSYRYGNKITNLELVFNNMEGISLVYSDDVKTSIICNFSYFNDFETFAYSCTALLKTKKVKDRIKKINNDWFKTKHNIEICTYQSV